MPCKKHKYHLTVFICHSNGFQKHEYSERDAYSSEDAIKAERDWWKERYPNSHIEVMNTDA